MKYHHSQLVSVYRKHGAIISALVHVKVMIHRRGKDVLRNMTGSQFMRIMFAPIATHLKTIPQTAFLSLKSWNSYISYTSLYWITRELDPTSLLIISNKE